MAVCDKNDLIVATDRKWQYFIAASAVIYFGGLVMVLIGRFIYLLVKKGTRKSMSVSDVSMPGVHGKKQNDEMQDASWYVALKEGAGALVSAQTLQGRILVCSSSSWYSLEFRFILHN